MIEEYKGYARLASSDSLEFWRIGQVYESNFDDPSPNSVIPGPVFPVAEVDSLDVVTYEVTPGAIVLVVVTVGLVALVVVGMSVNVKTGPIFGNS